MSSSNKRVHAYLDSFAEAASANKECIQEMKCAASSKDDQLAELIFRIDARDSESDKQMRTKDRQIGDLIDKLTSMSTIKNNNDDGYANKHKRGPKRERGVGGGGGDGSDGSKDESNKKAPSYDIKYKQGDGGAPRINWKQTKKRTLIGIGGTCRHGNAQNCTMRIQRSGKSIRPPTKNPAKSSKKRRRDKPWTIRKLTSELNWPP